MRRVRANSGRRVAAAVVDVTAAGDTAAGVTVASEEAAATSQPPLQRTLQPHWEKFGQGWIRTSEGVKPADLQSAPFGHFGTYPSGASDSYILVTRSLQLASSVTAVDPRFRATTLLRWRLCAAFSGWASSWS